MLLASVADRRMTRRHALLATAAAATIGGLAAGVLGARAAAVTPPATPARSFLRGAVAFHLPPGWEVQAWIAEGGAEGVALQVPCAALDPTPHGGNVNLLAEPNAGGEGLASWSARRLAVAAPREPVEERSEAAWRTVVSRGEDGGVPYVVVERFGVSRRARVHAVAAWPVLPETRGAWLARTEADVARFLDSIALEGAPPSRVRLAPGAGAARLALR